MIVADGARSEMSLASADVQPAAPLHMKAHKFQQFQPEFSGAMERCLLFWCNILAETHIACSIVADGARSEMSRASRDEQPSALCMKTHQFQRFQYFQRGAEM